MKKCMILKAPTSQVKDAKKVARQLKKAHEKLWGPGSCEVVVVTENMDVVTVCETWEQDSLCSAQDCPKV